MSDGKSILIIDDEKDLCLLLKDYFVRNNYSVLIAHTLQGGLQQLHTFKPDFLLLDNNLPDGAGWNAAPQLAVEYPTLFILFISAFRFLAPEMPDGAYYAVMEKPIRFADLDVLFAEKMLLTT